MRIGIVSDVHGNAVGLATALVRMGDVDEVLCVGDVVEDFRFSNDAVCSSCCANAGRGCVKGNHDIGVLAARVASRAASPACAERPRVLARRTAVDDRGNDRRQEARDDAREPVRAPTTSTCSRTRGS